MENEKKKTEYVPGLISIIVPVYNVRNYLRRCIDSIVRQTYTDIEILIIDDGSDDGSGQICDDYQKEDKRIKVFHVKNRGASAARNLGLDNARGEFIGFVDSDDYIKEDMYASLYNYMRKEIDIVCCGTALLFPDRMCRRTELYGKAANPVSYSNREALKELLLVKDLSFSLWNKLYRRELFQNIRFPEGKICEDYPVIYAVVKRCRNVTNIGKVQYFYCYRDGSVSKSPFDIKKLSYVFFIRDIYKDVSLNYPNEKKYGEALYIRSVVDTYRDISKCADQDKYETIQGRLRKLLRRMLWNILLNQYITKVTKKEVLGYLFLRGNIT